MGQITVTPPEFAELLVCFLLDNMKSKENMLGNFEEWQQFIHWCNNTGMSSKLVDLYSHMDSKRRTDYKFISEIFKKNTSGTHTILITGDKDTELVIKKKKDSLIKRIIKKVIQVMKEHQYKTGWPVNETQLDKIIDRVTQKINESEEK